MKLVPIPATHIDLAWRHGATSLKESCDVSKEEITIDQLKLLLSRGERFLFRIDEEGVTRGWVVTKPVQLPNKRVLLVTDLVCKNAHFERWMPALKEIAFAQGCLTIRCSAQPGQARLYKRRLGFKPVFETLEVEL